MYNKFTFTWGAVKVGELWGKNGVVPVWSWAIVYPITHPLCIYMLHANLVNYEQSTTLDVGQFHQSSSHCIFTLISLSPIYHHAFEALLSLNLQSAQIQALATRTTHRCSYSTWRSAYARSSVLRLRNLN